MKKDKIDEKSCRNFFIYDIGYVTIKQHVKNYSVNPSYLIFRNERMLWGNSKKFACNKNK